MFDVFYIGKKPGLFVHERAADSIQHAQFQSRTRYCWIISYLADYSDWDFLWEPVPWQSDFVHVWPSQWHDHSGTYLVSKHADCQSYHFQDRVIPNRSRPEEFACHEPDIEFDWTWSPHPLDPPFRYVFGNQWWPANKWPTVEYACADTTDLKFIENIHAMLPARRDGPWKVLMKCDWDYSWRPDPGDPPYTYVFGNQWWPPEKMPTVEYHVPGAIERKFVHNPRAVLPVNKDHWQIPDGFDASTIDLSWVPDPGSPAYIYQFGTQWQKTGGPRYVVPGATEIKYEPSPRFYRTVVDAHWQKTSAIDDASFDWTWHPDATDQPYIYQFGTQWQKTGGPRYVVPGATEIKFVPIPRAIKITKDAHWEIPAGAEYSDDFDWTWHPDDTEQPYIYQFGTQHQKTGGPIYRTPGATEIKYVDQIKITVKASRAPVYIIDHMDGNAKGLRDALASMITVEKTSRYVDNYLDTLRRIASAVPYQTEYIWIVSSICDYSDFDFTWYPEQWQATMLHVFASDGEKFGDTFFMHVPTFRMRSQTCQLLDWYDINYVPIQSVPRRPMPVLQHQDDTHVEQVKHAEWAGPLALFSNGAVPEAIPTVPLWREKIKTIVPLSNGAGSVIVPKTAVPYIKNQLYDYPYIDRTQRVLKDHALDIVFISNGEHGADHHWHVLHESLAGHVNQVHRVDGVNGRVAAYQAAATCSQTPWFFAVFAKLQVNADFDWSWQPDRMQEAKHYIFHAYNPVNQLVYGHQAMIAYNRAMTLTNTGEGLDFTLDQPHEVVPVVSGTAYYDNDPWTCWRTAFRECIKLRHSLPDVENDYRLQQWLSIGEGTNGHWSTTGANDAVKYYESVGGDFFELKKSYEWSWLASYAMMIHPELVTQSRT